MANRPPNKRQKKKALQKTTRSQRKASSQKSTVAIEAIKTIVNILKPWELSQTQRYKTYQSMLRDDAVWSSWESRSNFIQEAQQNGKFKYDVNNPESVKLARYFTYCMSSMDTQTPRTVAGNASEMVINGFAPFEIVTKDGSGEWSDAFALKKLSYINPLTLDPVRPFETENGGDEIVEWYQSPTAFLNSDGISKTVPKNSKGKIPIDARKVMLCSYSSSQSTPTSISAFDAAYNAWREKLLINDFLIMGVQKDMAGIPILEVPQDLLDQSNEENSDAFFTIQALKEQMTNLHAGDQSFMIMPSDTHAENGSGAKLYNITFKGIEGGSKVFDLEDLIDQRNRAIHKALGALNINSAEQGSASYNSLEGQTNIQYHYVKNDCRIIDDMWNKQVFPLLIKLNGWEITDPSIIPVWEHGEIQDVSLEEFSKYFQRGKLFLPLVPEVVNRYLEVAKINYRVPDNMSTEELKSIMAAAEDRSGEGDGTSGFGGNTQDMDNNNENKA